MKDPAAPHARRASLQRGRGHGARTTCCRIQVCMAIPAATPALIDRVDPNWAIETVNVAAARASGVSPGPS